MSKTFVVDFFYNSGKVSNRTRIQGSTLFLNNATSEFAVLNYLKSKYGPDVTINSVEWK